MFYKPEKTKKKKKSAAAKISGRIFRLMKPLHKFIGLFLILFLIWMSLSGILLNHKSLISGISVPSWMVPEHYHLKNWSRSSLVDIAFVNEDLLYVAGRQGVWKSEDAGMSFRPAMGEPFPQSAYLKKTRDLLIAENERSHILYAATQSGLFALDLSTEKWYRIETTKKHENFVKLVKKGDSIFAFSNSRIYLSDTGILNFRQIDIPRHEPEKKVTLIELFFELHGGKAWGLPGRLLYDFAGLVIIFLSISAFYLWFYPKKCKFRSQSNPSKKKIFKALFKYHLKLGIWLGLILLIIGGTGLFMRPPMLAFLLGKDIPAKYYPGIQRGDWHHKIRNAMYDHIDDEIHIDATDGYWTAQADLSNPFEKSKPPVPIFPMGATVFETLGNGDYLIGSFLGLHQVNRNGEVKDYFTGRDTAIDDPVRPGINMVTGWFQTPSGAEYVNDHYRGLSKITGEALSGAFEMPERMSAAFKMPLWNYMFEIHNGRFFKGVLGSFHILIIPLGSLLFIIISMTGIYDWIFMKVLKKRLK